MTECYREKKRTNRPSHALAFTQFADMIYLSGGKRFALDPHHALILPRGSTYTSDCLVSGEVFVINFDSTEDFSPEAPIEIPVEDVTEFIRTAKKIKQMLLFYKDDITSNGHLDSMRLLYTIFVKMYNTGLAHSDRKKYDILSPALKYMRENLSDAKLTNAVLAEKAHISDVYFRRLFKSEFGVSPKQYIQDIRIRKAEELLADGSQSVTLVAEKVGYASVYHFCRSFKKATGYTPSRYSALFTNEL